MALIDDLRNDSGIRERDCGNGVSSFNFTSKTFRDGAWNSRTIKSRGLFISQDTGEIVARSYDKFFAVGERPETEWEALRKTLVFPAEVAFKYNGFLDILSAHFEDDEYILDFHTKSCMDGWYVDEFKRIFMNRVGEYTCGEIAKTLCKENMSAVFEVISLDDPHIIEYSTDHVILLDLIHNAQEFKPMNYHYLENFARRFNLMSKTVIRNFYSFSELKHFLVEESADLHIEGYVVRDKNNFMFKVKLPWYKYWKRVRSVVDQLGKGKYPNEIKNYKERIDDDVMAEQLPDFVYNYVLDTGRTPSVIDVRNEFYPQNIYQY